MSTPSWKFEQVGRMGGATGEAYTNPLHGSGMKPVEILAREAIQNSSDANRSDEKVNVTFRRVTLTGAKKKAFVKRLGLGGEFVARRKVLEYQQGNCIQTLAKDDAPLNLLYIEDYNTHGLYGDPHKSDSHFFRLLLSLGDSSKSRGKEGSGGSYGYGKSVYSANSRIHTIVAYSVFKPKDDGSKRHARLMACGYFNTHHFGEEQYSGRAWFGLPSTEYPGDIDPLHDEAAHNLAQELGFVRRDRTDTGTSILLVDCGVECEALRASIEDWWWPRFLEDGLDVMLYEQYKRLEPPRPKHRADLKPFIRCYEMAVGRSAPTGKHDKQGALYRRANGISPGAFGYSILGEQELADEKLQSHIGHIALIRAPRMVVSYMQVGGSMPLPCVGAFVASPDVDTPLKMSEPVSHDKWDPNSTRLQNLKEDEREIVASIINSLKGQMRKFSNEAAPPTPTKDVRLRMLERLLGKMFKPPTTTDDDDGGHPAAPIEIKFVEQPHPVTERGGLRTEGSFRLSLAEDAARRAVDAWVEVECFVVEDESLSREDPISVKLTCENGDASVDKERPHRLNFKLENGNTPTFAFKSERYQPDWSTFVRVNVEEA